jgi:hypothetical protein
MEIVIKVLDKLTCNSIVPIRVNNDIKLSEVAKAVNEIMDVKLKVMKVEEILKSLGFRVTYTHGIKYIRKNPTLLSLLVWHVQGKLESNHSKFYSDSTEVLPEVAVPA